MALYEVKLIAVCVVAVEAGSEVEALERACEEATPDDYEFVEGGPAKEIKDPVYQESVRRHAHLFLARATQGS